MVQELICIGFTVEHLLNRLQEIARALFIRKIQLVVVAIDTRIENLKKEVADLKACHKRLFSGVTSPSHFKDQVLISSL